MCGLELDDCGLVLASLFCNRVPRVPPTGLRRPPSPVELSLVASRLLQISSVRNLLGCIVPPLDGESESGLDPLAATSATGTCQVAVGETALD